jgi:predicted metalloprotease with PDZ domain
VAMLLDLELRARTRDAKSLDDLMRLLWARYGDEKGVPEDGIEAAASEIAGSSMAEFFAKSVHAPGELDFAPLGHVGLLLRRRVRDGAGDKGGTPGKEADAGPKAYLGALTKNQNDRCLVSSALAGSPAQRDGLHADDEIVAVDGYRIEPEKLTGRIEEYAVGQKVSLTVFRRDQLRTVEIVLGEKPQDALWLARSESPTEDQKRAYARWLGESWDATPAT